jgi:hypothetical protein
MADSVEEKALNLLADADKSIVGHDELSEANARIRMADVYARLAVAKAINQLSTEVGSGLTHMVNEMWKR